MAIQYLFSNMKLGGEESHVLRVKSPEPVDLPIGVYLSTTERSADMEVHHDFKVSGLLKKDTDAEGNHYAWYTLSEHVKSIDRSPAAAAAAAQNAANIDYISMMSGIDLPEETAQEGGAL